MNIVYRLLHRLSGSQRPLLGDDDVILVIGPTGQFEPKKDTWIDPKLAKQEIRREFVARYFGWMPRIQRPRKQETKAYVDPWSPVEVAKRRRKIADEDEDYVD